LESSFHAIFFIALQIRPGEPVYAQVNRDKKKNSRNHSDGQMMMVPHHPLYSDYSEHAEHWQQQQVPPQHHHQQQQQQQIQGPAAAGDSWV
jgi:hypothetical protein